MAVVVTCIKKHRFVLSKGDQASAWSPFCFERSFDTVKGWSANPEPRGTREFQKNSLRPRSANCRRCEYNDLYGAALRLHVQMRVRLDLGGSRQSL